jgi:prevent-host-death family protein
MWHGGFNMEITAKELRCKPGQIIEQVVRGTKVVITIRGKKIARIIPYTSEKGNNSNKGNEDEIFALWQDREDIEIVDDYVRNMRKRRVF